MTSVWDKMEEMAARGMIGGPDRDPPLFVGLLKLVWAGLRGIGRALTGEVRGGRLPKE